MASAPKEYSRVILSLENCFIPEERLRETPSRKDGVSSSLEVDLRIVGCEYIQSAGLLLRLPQVAMATGQVLFQRFFYSKSFVKYSVFPMAMACLYVAAKIEENCRRLRDIINVFHHLKQKRTGRTIVPMEYTGEQYFTTKNTVIKYERFLLKELGFCVHVQHPHKLIISYLKFLEQKDNTQLAQRAWNYMNDSLQTNVFVRFSIQAIACACLFLSARHLEIPLPEKPAWWLLFDVKYRDVKAISYELLALYQHTKQPLEELEKQITALREQLQKRQIEIKEVALVKGPGTNSQSGSPNVSSPLLALPISGQLKAQSKSPQLKGAKVAVSSPLVQQTSRISPSNTVIPKQSSPISNGQKRGNSAASSPSGSPSEKKPRLIKLDSRRGSLHPPSLPQAYKPIHSPIRISSEDDHSTRSSGSASRSPASMYNGALALQGSEDERLSHRRHHKHRSSDKHRHRERSRSRSTSREPEHHRHHHRHHHHHRRDHHESKREHERYTKYDMVHSSSSSDRSSRDRDYYNHRLRKSESYR